jgi:NTE family protein
MMSGADVTQRRPKVALVIGSGALKCVAAFGVLKVLQREGIQIDMVVACSGGAFCGVWTASGGGDADAEAERFAQGWRGSFDQLNWRAILRACLPRWLGRRKLVGIVDDRVLNRAVRAFVGERVFEDLKIPLYLMATDFVTGERVVLSSGPLFDGIRATISIPLVLPSWQVGGRTLVDGGVSDPLPIDVAMREGADVIIALGFEDRLETSLHSGVDQLIQLTSIMMNNLYRSQYAFHSMAHHSEVIAIIPEFEATVGLRDLHLVPYLVECGATATEREIPYLRRLLQTSAPYDTPG